MNRHIDLATESFPLTWTHPDLIRWMVETGTQGNVLEIGTHQGGSAIALMSLVPDNEHFIVTVDPWGRKPYYGGSEYDDDIQRLALETLASASLRHGINWHHFKMSGIDFMKLSSREELQPWYAGAQRLNRFSTIFLDGDHNIDVVLSEFEEAIKLTEYGGVIFIDNINHAQDGGRSTEEELIKAGWRWDFSDFSVKEAQGDRMMRVSSRQLY